MFRKVTKELQEYYTGIKVTSGKLRRNFKKLKKNFRGGELQERYESSIKNATKELLVCYKGTSEKIQRYFRNVSEM